MGQAASARRAWRAKNVTPILYEETNSHDKLHRTLHVWASLYRDGIRGKERLVARLAIRDPKRAPQRTTLSVAFCGR